MNTVHTYDNVRQHIKNRVTFQTRERVARDGSGTVRHLRANWWSRPGVYVVYSYGYHYPMFVYDPDIDQWFVNDDKSSRTTENHKSRFAPCSNMLGRTTAQLTRMIESGGFVKEMAERVSA